MSAGRVRIPNRENGGGKIVKVTMGVRALIGWFVGTAIEPAFT